MPCRGCNKQKLNWRKRVKETKDKIQQQQEEPKEGQKKVYRLGVEEEVAEFNKLLQIKKLKRMGLTQEEFDTITKRDTNSDETGRDTVMGKSDA